MNWHALAAAAATDQGAHQPVTTPKQPRLIALGDLEQLAERGAQEIARSIAEHLEKRPIAGPDAAVAIERQDRCRAVLDQGRHERGIAGVATLIASGRREADQRADAQRSKAGRKQCARRQGKGTRMACDRGPEKHQSRPGGKGQRHSTARTSDETAERAPRHTTAATGASPRLAIWSEDAASRSVASPGGSQREIPAVTGRSSGSRWSSPPLRQITAISRAPNRYGQVRRIARYRYMMFTRAGWGVRPVVRPKYEPVTNGNYPRPDRRLAACPAPRGRQAAARAALRPAAARTDRPTVLRSVLASGSGLAAGRAGPSLRRGRAARSRPPARRNGRSRTCARPSPDHGRRS